jgi:hypothetical protein
MVARWQDAMHEMEGIFLNSSKTRLWALIAVIALALGALTAAGCGGGDDNTTSGGGGGSTANLGLKESGTLLIGSDIPYPPFEFGDAPDYTGTRSRSGSG